MNSSNILIIFAQNGVLRSYRTHFAMFWVNIYMKNGNDLSLPKDALIIWC